MHVISAPEAGSGKSYLVDVAAAIATGQPCPVLAAGRTEEETEKRLAAALLAGQPLISIDNLNGDLGGDALCQAIERPIVELRPLGKSELVRIEARSTLFATGNNIRIRGDLTRRALRCRLDPRSEHPEFRQFKHRPVDVVLAARGHHISAALTLVRSYVAAGNPNRAPPLASFEGWSDLVRSSLIWVGRADPVDTMRAARENDPNREAAAVLFKSWQGVFGLQRSVVAAEVVQAASAKDISTKDLPTGTESVEFRYPELRESLLAVVGRRGAIDTREFGKWLSRYRDCTVSGLRLEGKSDRHGRAVLWSLVTG
jgi:putative DNA primase/helicase